MPPSSPFVFLFLYAFLIHNTPQYCSTESEDSFADTHNGFELPYSSGGLVPDTCMSCMTMNDNYEYEISEMCKRVYDDASYRCEENMEQFNSYYGQDTRGCDYLSKEIEQYTTAVSDPD